MDDVKFPSFSQNAANFPNSMGPFPILKKGCESPVKRSKVIEFRFIYSLEYSIMNVGSNFYAYICMLNIILMLVNFGPENLSRGLVLVLYVHIDINCSKYDVYSDTKLK